MRWRNAVFAGLVAMLPIALLALGFGRDPHALPSMLVGKPAPDFVLSTLDGAEVSLASMRGKPVVINFWASWCLPCRAEHEVLLEAYAALANRVHFLGIVYEDTAENVRKIVAQGPKSYPHLIDPASRTALDFGVTGVPETFFIDADGTIVEKHAGALNAPSLLRAFEKMSVVSKER